MPWPASMHLPVRLQYIALQIGRVFLTVCAKPPLTLLALLGGARAAPGTPGAHKPQGMSCTDVGGMEAAIKNEGDIGFIRCCSTCTQDHCKKGGWGSYVLSTTDQKCHVYKAMAFSLE
jgi:hypothetical protein